jgi:Xaa-Pro aminopeptidase
MIDLSDVYTSLRMVKSSEEIAWMRVGAELTDRSLESLVTSAQIGSTEADLADAVERAYVPAGGTNHIHFFAVTNMSNPQVCVPAQWPSSRSVEPGDVIVTELSTSYWGYPGQLLRTIAVGGKPTSLYRDLHDVAESAFAAIVGRIRSGVHVRELVTAAELIAAAGFTIYDDLVHGFGGGYLPPVLRTQERQHEPIPDITLRAGMTIVVQPNVITVDERAGVQTGELLLVTEDGVERLHAAPQGLLLA